MLPDSMASHGKNQERLLLTLTVTEPVSYLDISLAYLVVCPAEEGGIKAQGPCHERCICGGVSKRIQLPSNGGQHTKRLFQKPVVHGSPALAGLLI